MNTEEARKVLWSKTNPRPLGELMEEGYLNQDRLEWAAQRAYNPQLKQAAQALLEHGGACGIKAEGKPGFTQGKTLPVKISLEKARATLWPFKPYKGEPMGPLIEAKQLSLKDLGYAVENAWDERVKQAAIALALVRLEQALEEPVPLAGYVNVVSGGRSFAERRQLFLALIDGFISGVLFGFALMLFIFSIINSTKSHPDSKTFSEIVSSPNGVIALIGVIGMGILFALLINFLQKEITHKFDEKIEQHRLGQEGEERAVQSIVQALDGNWQLFRNVSLPGRNKVDLDLVLVGPPGVWALEVKNLRGAYRNIGETWEYRCRKAWKRLSKSLSRQALNSAIRLATFLRADHLSVFVNPALVWANVESPLQVENPSVPVWLYDRLPDELGNIWQVENLTKVERSKIAEKLAKVCERQRDS